MTIPARDDDYDCMQRALALARATAGLASPNPQVGCVLVRDGRVLGDGAHRYEQRDHAEIVALKAAAAAGHEVTGATAYVTLEPCSHHGRTGPCAEALIAARVGRVVLATADPNPQVSGRGIAKLRAAGITVEVGLCEAEARALIDAFAFSMTHDRAYVTLKAALSVDGHLAPAEHLRQAGEPFWLTGAEARAEVHRMRHAADALVTGIGTVLADDPLLTDRSGLPRRRPLVRIVLDSDLRLPVTSKLVRSCQDDLWVVSHASADRARSAELAARGVRVVQVHSASGTPGRLNLGVLFEELHQAALISLLLEGGSRVNGTFLTEGLVDRVVLFYAETELGRDALPFAQTTAGRVSPFALEQSLLKVERRQLGADVMVTGNLHDPWLAVERQAAGTE